MSTNKPAGAGEKASSGNKILSVEALLPGLVYRMKFSAPNIARKRKPGQFILLRIDEVGERIPLTIADANADEGSLTIIWQVVGFTTTQLSEMEPGQFLLDVAGPLGEATEVEKFGRVACVGGGIGVAPLFPIVEALKAAGNEVNTIVGSRNKDLLILENEMRAHSDRLGICTDDGSAGFKGFVSQLLDNWMTEDGAFDHVFAIGPVPMMKATVAIAKKYEVPITVSLNPIMVDGTGMCGGCRVTVHGETKFCCVDGPEFDGHGVDFDELTRRLGAYKEYEKIAMEKHDCKIGRS
jgi:ferredoxin/flavodoxin---NADP+ reductase